MSPGDGADGTRQLPRDVQALSRVRASGSRARAAYSRGDAGRAQLRARDPAVHAHDAAARPHGGGHAAPVPVLARAPGIRGGAARRPQGARISSQPAARKALEPVGTFEPLARHRAGGADRRGGRALRARSRGPHRSAVGGRSAVRRLDAQHAHQSHSRRCTSAVPRDRCRRALDRGGAVGVERAQAHVLSGAGGAVRALSRSDYLSRLTSTVTSETHLASPQLKPRDGDLFNIDAALAEDERAVRDSVRRFVDERVLPIIGQCYVEGRFPKEIIPEMAELGLFGANLPEEYGCAGLSNVSYGLIMQELERGDSGVRSFASVQGALVMYPIFAFGSEAQKKEWLPKMAKGEVIGCFGLTEPDFGSNPPGVITRARAQEDGSWLLNGAKMWITNGSTAHVSIVWAKTADNDSEGTSIRGFIVPTNSKGFKAKDVKGKLSLRASDTSELVFSDVHLPADAVLPKSGTLKSPLMCLTQARYGISWGAIGAAMACYEEALAYSQQRVMFDRPIGGVQLQQQRLPA